jgi:hypothetical protein
MIKEKNLIYLLISSTIVTIAWISFTLYHAISASTIDEHLGIQIQPIPPQFNPASIQRIIQRSETPPTYEVQGGVSLTTEQNASNAAQRALTATPPQNPSQAVTPTPRVEVEEDTE